MFRYVILDCSLAISDHFKSRRQYAHVNHEDGVICVCPPFWSLPDGHLFGVLAHEVGHLLANHLDPDHSEGAADAAFASTFGYPITYKSGLHGENLQWLPNQERRRFIKEFDISLDTGWIMHSKLPPPPRKPGRIGAWKRKV